MINKDDSFTHKRSEFISVEFKLKNMPKEDKVYQLQVFNSSQHGFGVLITKKDFDLLQIIKLGDKFQNMMFFAKWAMVKVDGIVKHIAKIKTGKYKDSYFLGIESQDII